MRSFTFGLITSVLVLASPAIAHHGPIGNPELYLSENLIEFEGEITEVFWRNPHPRLRMSVADDAGEEVIWELELDGSPISYNRRGISAEDFAQVGDHVRVAGVEALFATRSLGVLHYLRPDGQEHVFRNRELRWSTDEFAPPENALDPAIIAEARRTADGIFRVWGNNTDGSNSHPPLASYAPFLTARGRELADNWVRATDDPELRCQQGMPTTMFDPVPTEFVVDGDRILLRIQEYDVERVIHMNADAGVAEPEPSALGYSVGRWEGDTLSVTTTHIDWSQFDPYGTPQSDQTQYLERFRFSPEDETLEHSFTATDPIIFTQPIHFERRRRWTPGVELVAFNCASNWGVAAE